MKSIWLTVLVLFSAAHFHAEQFVPLCSEVHGFASEINDKFIIESPMDFANDNNESLVLVAQAFPLNLGTLSQGWLSLKASYRTAQGSLANLASDNNGILQISSVSPSTEIEVSLVRVRKDGPVPFRFFSFQANYPACYIELSPERSFVAPIPQRLSTSSSPRVTLYFKTLLPTDTDSIVLSSAYSGESKIKYVDVLSEDKKLWTRYDFGEVLTGVKGENIFYSITPEETRSDDHNFLYLTVTYTDSDGRPPKTPEKNGEGGNPPQGTGSKEEKSESPFFTFLTLTAIFLCLYFIGGSFYNYTRNNIKEFPDYIPHIDVFRSCAQGGGSFLHTVRGGSRGDYASVPSYGENQNPYNL